MLLDTLPDLLLLAAHPLAHLNALLNSVAGVLLVTGYILIRRGRETAHKWTMLAASGVSGAFLTSYVIYHVSVGSVKFGGSGAIRSIYLTILFSHVILAFVVLILVPFTIYFGLRNRREKHRRIARWTFPIWIYVSVTGVIVYLMLYHLFPNPGA